MKQTIIVFILWFIFGDCGRKKYYEKMDNCATSCTTLNDSLTPDNTVLVVANTSGFSAGDYIIIGTVEDTGSTYEIIKIGTINDATTFSGCLRGQCNTSALIHAEGRPVTKYTIPRN